MCYDVGWLAGEGAHPKTKFGWMDRDIVLLY